MSSQSSSPLGNESILIPSLPVSSAPSTSSPLPSVHKDYDLWTPERFEGFRGFVCKQNALAERADWWKYGYRIRNEATGKIMWTKKHLSYHNLPASLTDRNIVEILAIDSTNPTQQAIVSRLSNTFNPTANRLLILDWLTANNPSFRIVNDPRFQRLLLYNNPLLQVHDLPKAMTLWRALHDEYRRALPYY
ncbi:hypothetical protein HD806DRAFT_538935 [Xylariaceae sp. AK1471]|nr:hypothetical protein HD806DRAFT_538935 [Xylariaceae sp. AK1471]